MTFLSKQSKLEKAISKYDRSQERGETKRKLKRLHDEAWAKVSAQVSVRDTMTCRVCGCQTTRWGIGRPEWWGSAHHIIYRSAGGLDVLPNLVWLCFKCHQDEHDHELIITGTSDALRVERAA